MKRFLFIILTIIGLSWTSFLLAALAAQRPAPNSSELIMFYLSTVITGILALLVMGQLEYHHTPEMYTILLVVATIGNMILMIAALPDATSVMIMYIILLLELLFLTIYSFFTTMNTKPS